MRFLGRVSDQALDALYRDCAFFVMPSRDEGFGLVFLEAMRAGKACIGGAGAAAEVIEDGVTGLVVDAAEPDEVAKAVVRLFLEPDDAGAHGAGGGRAPRARVHRGALSPPLPRHPGARRAVTAVLGISAYHGDAAAALVVDGRLEAAVEEERFARVKHWAGFPRESIRSCLAMAGMTPADVDHFAIGRNPRSNLWRKARFALAHRPSLGLVSDRARSARRVQHAAAALADALGLDRARVDERLHWVEHHPAHLASAFLVSPFDEAAVCAIDGFGDFVSTSWAIGRGASIEGLDRVYFPHSLGLFYLAVTQHLGFTSYGDEYKVMGLAPYGAPDFAGALSRVLRLLPGGGFALDLSYFRHASGGVRMTWDDGAPAIDPGLSRRSSRISSAPRGTRPSPSTPRHEAIAASLQSVFERAVFHVLRGLHARTRQPRLCLAGGCAMNSVANGKIREETPFREVYVQPAAGDDGTALGAAFHVWSRLPGGSRRFVDGPRVLGAGVRSRGRAAGARRAARAELARQGMHVDRARRRRGALPLHRRAPRRGPGRGLVPGPDGVGGAGPRQPEHPRRSPAGGHARDHQREDQAARGVPAVRPLHPRGGARRVLRRSRPPTRS